MVTLAFLIFGQRYASPLLISIHVQFNPFGNHTLFNNHTAINLEELALLRPRLPHFYLFYFTNIL